MIGLLNVLTEDCSERGAERLRQLMTDLERNPEEVRRARGRITFVFPDHEHLQSVFGDASVRSFIRAAHKLVPHLFYYLAAEPELGAVQAFFLCHASDSSLRFEGGRLGAPVTADLLALFTDRITEVARFAERIADDPTQLVLALVAQVPTVFRADPSASDHE